MTPGLDRRGQVSHSRQPPTVEPNTGGAAVAEVGEAVVRLAAVSRRSGGVCIVIYCTRLLSDSWHPEVAEEATS